VQQHAATVFAQAEAAAGADLPQFVNDEFDAFLECGILAHGFLRLRCGDCGHDKLIASSCKRRGSCPSWRCPAIGCSSQGARPETRAGKRRSARGAAVASPGRAACCVLCSRRDS
jgi:ribosomal protein S27E